MTVFIQSRAELNQMEEQSQRMEVEAERQQDRPERRPQETSGGKTFVAKRGTC